jgi:ankyrin repeat protein
MAVHRGRIDLLEQHLSTGASLLSRRYSLVDIFPPELGIKPGDGLCGTPLDGVTLLHMAVEYHDDGLVRWLLDNGADVNAPADVDADGFGGQTPVYHAVVTLGGKEDTLVRTLLQRGADPNPHVTLRKQLRDTGDPDKDMMREYRDVTPTAYARRFVDPSFVNESAIAAVREYGGVEDVHE